jgi:hypothetical protein
LSMLSRFEKVSILFWRLSTTSLDSFNLLISSISTNILLIDFYLTSRFYHRLSILDSVELCLWLFFYLNATLLSSIYIY